MRILVFGDSITYGECDTQGGWADRLKADYFKQQIVDLDNELPMLYNLGIGGDITKHLTQRLPNEVTARQSLWGGPDDFTLVFAIGINDSLSSAGKDFSSPAQYAKDLELLYQAATKFTTKLLFVGLTPVEQDNPRIIKYSNQRIWQFETVLRGFVAEKQLAFVPLFELLQEHMAAGETLYADGLHPNDDGHRLMYEQIAPALHKLAPPFEG